MIVALTELGLDPQAVCLPKCGPFTVLTREGLTNDAYTKYARANFDIVELSLSSNAAVALVRLVRAAVDVGVFAPASTSKSEGAGASTTASQRHAPSAGTVTGPVADFAKDVAEIGVTLLSRNDFDVLADSAAFELSQLSQQLVTIAKASSAVTHSVLAVQVCNCALKCVCFAIVLSDCCGCVCSGASPFVWPQ